MSTRVIDDEMCSNENKLKIKKYHTRIHLTVDLDFDCNHFIFYFLRNISLFFVVGTVAV